MSVSISAPRASALRRGAGAATGSASDVASTADIPPPVDADPAVPASVPVQPVEQPVVIGEPLAEAAVLGCVLRAGPDQARAVLGLLGEDCWSVPQHAHVATAARALLARGEPVDPVTVLGQLRRQGIENARTASTDAGVFLVELCQAAPCVSNAGHYARIVLEHAYRRRVQAAALRLLHAADTADLTELCELVDAEHTAVARAGHRAVAPGPLPTLPSS